MTKQSDLLRLVEGECSPEEAAAIQAWVAADPARGELLDQVRALWRLTGDPSRPWDLAGARDRLLRVRGRHAAQRSGGLPARSRATGFLRMARAGPLPVWRRVWVARSEEHTSELQSQSNLVCRLLLEKKKKTADVIVSNTIYPPS